MSPAIKSAGAEMLAAQEQAMPEKRRPSRQPDIPVHHSHVKFPSTIVSLLNPAKSPDPIVRKAAQDELFELYRHACYTFFRQLRLERRDANDLVADVWEKLDKGALLRTYRPERGRFRAYLKQVLRHLAWDGFAGPQPPAVPLDGQQVVAATPTPSAHVADRDREEYRRRGLTLLAEAVRNLMAKAAAKDMRASEKRRRQPSTSKKTDSHTSAFARNLELARRMTAGETSLEIGEDVGLSEHAVRARARLVRSNLEAEMRRILYDRFKEGVKPTGQDDQNEMELTLQQKVDDQITFILDALGETQPANNSEDKEAESEPR